MSKTYKVHEDFDLEHLSWDEENCHCDAPSKHSKIENIYAELINESSFNIEYE